MSSEIPTPADSLREFVVALERQASSAQQAINQAYEDLGRYEERLRKTREAIARTNAAIAGLEA